MKRLLTILLILCTIGVANGQVSTRGTYDPGAARDTLSNVVPATGRDALQVYSEAEVDEHLGVLAAGLAAGNRVYYCSSGTEDIGGVTYGLLSQSLDPVETNVSIGPIVGTTYAQYSPGRGRITPAAGLGVTSLPAGVFNRASFMANPDTAGRTITGVYELWRVDSAGTKIALLATSTPFILQALGSGVIQRTDVTYSLAASVAVDTTDRLMEEYFFKRSGTTTGTDFSITRYIGGTHAGLVSFALPSGVTMLTSGTNSADHVAFKNASFTGDIQGTRLGLGIAPGYRLHLRGSEGDVQHRLDIAGYAGIQIRPNSGKSGWLSFTEDSVGDRWVTGIAAGDTKFYWKSGSEASNVKRMSLDANGNLAITGDASAVNGSFTGDIDVAGDVGAATVNGVAPLTSAEKTQALVGSSTVDFIAKNTTNILISGSYSNTMRGAIIPLSPTSTAIFSEVGSVTAALPCGVLNVISDTDGVSSIFALANATVTKLAGSAAVTDTKDSANAINIYVESNNLIIQNTRSFARDVRIFFNGAVKE